MNPNNFLTIAVIAQAGVPAVRIALALALIVFVFGGIFIFRRRHPFFERAPRVAIDGASVRQNGEEIFIIIGSALMLLLVGILHQVWSA